MIASHARLSTLSLLVRQPITVCQRQVLKWLCRKVFTELTHGCRSVTALPLGGVGVPLHDTLPKGALLALFVDAGDEEKGGSTRTNRGLPATCADDYQNCEWDYRLGSLCFVTTSDSSKLMIARLTGSQDQPLATIS